MTAEQNAHDIVQEETAQAAASAFETTHISEVVEGAEQGRDDALADLLAEEVAQNKTE